LGSDKVGLAMVQINISQLLKEPIGSTRNIEIKGIVDIIQDTGSDIQGEVILTRTDRGVLAKGTLYTEVEITCSRCLSLFKHPLKLNIEEEYLPIIDILTGYPVSIPNEAESLNIDEHHILDLTEALRQYALLGIPMKPLCRENCAGLCPDCGRNLNPGACGCPSRETDYRWSKLKRMVLSGDLIVNELEGKG